MLPVLVRRVAAAATVASSLGWCWFTQFDCQPLLFVQDAWMRRRQQRRRRRHQQGAARNNAAGALHFQGQSIWIIGASSGIGAELARRLAHPDCGVEQLILSSRSREVLDQLATDCQQLQDEEEEEEEPQQDEQKKRGGPQIHVVPLDVTDESNDWNQIVGSLTITPPTKTVNRLRPDIVIMNAGQGHLSPAIETNPQTARSMLTTNVAWLFSLIPVLLHQKPTTTAASAASQRISDKAENTFTHPPQPQLPPQLFVTSSVAGILPVPLSAAYAASKHAVNGYARSVAAEHPNLIVDLVCPGPVDDTNFLKSNNNNNNNNNNSKDDVVVTDTRSRNLKMPLNRCVDLMMTTLEQSNRLRRKRQLQLELTSTSGGGRLREVWIAQQPTLTALYLHSYGPQQLLNWLVGRIGQRRIEMYKQGLDLYDPVSWTKKSKSTQQQATTHDRDNSRED